MFATPLNYDDNPGEVLKELSNLTVYQAKYFAVGYIHSCNHVKEILTDTRSKFLTVAMRTEDEEKKRKITGITKTLDLLEEALDNRAKILDQFLKETEHGEEEKNI